MRSLLLFAFVSLACASLIQDQSYRARKEYRYKYETQIVTGMLPNTNYHNGFKLSAFARIQFTTRSEVQVIFEDIILYKIDQPVVSMEAEVHSLPTEDLKVWTGPDAETVINNLRIPFAFKYIDGHVVQVFLEEHETTQSANTKKGFIYLFEMNLEKRFMLEETVSTKTLTYTPITELYTVFERAPTGDCATMYTVKPAETTERLFVSKVRNYEKCLEKPLHFVSPFSGSFGNKYFKDTPLSRQANIDYSIKGTMDKFLILSAVAEERIVFTPYTNAKDGQIRTTVNQTLTIVDSKMISETTEIPEVTVSKKTETELLMALPSLAVDSQNPFVPSRQEHKTVEETSFSNEKILTHLRLAAQTTKDLTSKDSLVHLGLVTEMLTTATKLNIKMLFNGVMYDPLALDTLWNLLPHVGTQAAAEAILDKCAVDRSFLSKCNNVLNALTLTVTPTPLLINKLINLIYSSAPVFETNPELKQVLYLTLGSWGYKLTNTKNSHWKQMDVAWDMLQNLEKDNQRYIRKIVKEKKKDVKINRKNVETIYNEMGLIIMQELRKLVEEGNSADKILGLKAIGNSGLPTTIPVIKKILINPEEPQFLRIMSVIAYRRVAIHPKAREEAKITLTEVFMNDKETNELRNMAFTILMALKPELPLLEKIAHMMHNEKDIHVSSYIISMLQNYANTTYEPLEPVSRKFRLALESAPLYRTGIEHSFFKMFGKYFEQYKMGASVNLASLGSMDRFEGWALQLDTVIYGLQSKLFEVGVNTEGMTKFFNALFGPRGLVTLNKSFIQVLSRSPREINVQDLINNIFNELNVKPRDMKMPAGNLYFKMMGHEMRYFDLKNIVEPFLSLNGQLPMTFNMLMSGQRVDLPVDWNKLMCLFHVKMSMPTQAGLPVALKAMMSTNMKVTGSVHFKFGGERMETSTLPTTAVLGSDLKPKMITGLIASMGMDDLFVKPHVGFLATSTLEIPAQMEFSFDLLKKKLSLTHTMPEKQDLEVWSTKVEPFSHFLVINRSSQTPLIDINMRPIMAAAGARIEPISMTFPTIWGWDMVFSGQKLMQPNTMLPIFEPLKGRTEISWLLKPTQTASKKGTINVKYFEPQTEEMQPVKFDKFGRPLPSAMQNEVPSDPIDLNQDTLTIQQLIKKYESASGKTLPKQLLAFTHALVITFEASTDTIPRRMAFESLWSWTPSGKVVTMATQFWRTALPPLYTEPFKMLTEFEMTYPLKTYEPQDVFSTKVQTELLDELENHVLTHSPKVVNQLMNLTLNTMIHKSNYPAMRLVPAYRVLDGIIPELLWNLIEETNTNTPTTNWRQFWTKFGPLFDKVKEEHKLTVDPYFLNRDAILMNYLTELHTSQMLLMKELQSVVSTNTMTIPEFPIMQWVVFSQSHILNTIREVITKYKTSGVIINVTEIEGNLKHNIEAAEKINKLVIEIYTLRFTQSTKTKTLITQSLKTILNTQQVATSTLKTSGDLLTLREHLQNISIAQVKMIEEIMLNVNKGEKIDVDLLMKLITLTQNGIENLDEFIHEMPIEDTDAIHDLLLVTVQNEFLVQMWHHYWDAEVTRTDEQKETEILCDKSLKMLSFSLGARSSLVFEERKLIEIITPSMQELEFPLWRSIAKVRRQLLVEDKFMEIPTHTPKSIQDFVELVLQKFTNHVADLYNTIAGMKNLPKPPTVYLAATLMETLTNMKAITESARGAVLMTTMEERLDWIPRLEKLLNEIERTIADMSPIFERYTTEASKHMMLMTLPVNQKTLALQEVQEQQNEMNRYLQQNARRNIDVKPTTYELERLVKILTPIVDKSEDIQAIIETQLELEIEEDNPACPVRHLLSTIINQQLEIFTKIKSVMNDYSPTYSGFTELSDWIDTMEFDLSDCSKDLAEYIQLPSESDNLRSTQTDIKDTIIPTGIAGLLKMTWGNIQHMDNTASLEILATRSVEQLYWLFKQLDGVTRDQDLIWSVNRKLRDDMLEAESFKDVLNTFNHVHFTAKFEPEQLPTFIREKVTTFQEYIKYLLWPNYVGRQGPSPVMDKTTVETIVELSDLNNKWDLTLLTPKETDMFLGMTISPLVKAITPTRAVTPIYKRAVNYATAKFAPAICTMSKDAIKTWDTVTYQTPAQDDLCTRVLAMDCSPERNFVITITPTTTVPGRHIMDILAVTKNIRLVPQLLTTDIIVGDETIHLKDGTPFNLKKTINNIPVTEASIIRRGERVEVTLPLTGLNIVMEGSLINIEVSQLFKSRMCGLCSNFDSQRSWEFEGPTGKVFTEEKHFALSYVIPSTCPALPTPFVPAHPNIPNQNTPKAPRQNIPVRPFNPEAPNQNTPASQNIPVALGVINLESTNQKTPEEPNQKTPEEPKQKTPEDPNQKTPEEPKQKTPEEPKQKTPEEPNQKTSEEPKQKTPEQIRTTPEPVEETTTESSSWWGW